MNKNLLKIRKKIDEIVLKIHSGYDPDLIILFGSFAKESNNENSDVDLLIVKSTDKRPVWRRVEVRQIIDADIPVDVIVYTPKEFELLKNSKSFFFDEILNSGKILYEKTKSTH